MQDIKPSFEIPYDINNNILGNIKPDTKIYRVITLERFFELIKNNNLVLAKPKLWDDPFENLLSKTIIIDQQGFEIGFNVSNDFYGQCWTQKKECDGIWRNYASLQNGVKIQTTVQKLLNIVYNKDDNFSKINTFIGKVEYMSDKRIKDFLKNPNFLNWVLDSSVKNIAKTLLIKRSEFRYEKEVRVLFASQQKENIINNTKDIKKFNLSPIDFIEGIVFAPKMDNNLFNIYQEQLIKSGFNKKIISKSELYKPFNIKIKPDGI
jgi:hypothetical protein